MKTADDIKVWDLFVRLFHWALVAAFIVSYVTEGKPRWLHVNSGYLISALLVMRIFWGFVGPRHARFSDFVRSPKEVLGHLREVATFKAKRYLGHDPAGGAMIVALLLILSLTVLSGMLLYAAKDKAGPFAGWTAGIRWELPGAGQTAFASHGEGEREHKGGRSDKHSDEDWLEEVHEVLANIALTLAIIHVCGVLTVSFETRENLILGMITGRKRKIENP